MLKNLILSQLLLCLSLLATFLSAASAEEATAPFNCSVPMTKAAGAQKLKAAQQSYASVKAMQAQFLQVSYLAAADTSEQSSGMVYFEKPGKMRWNYLEPDEQTFLILDNTFWFYQKRENQLLIDNLQKMLIDELPLAFLMGMGNLQQDLDLLRACENEDGYLFELAPRASETPDTGVARELKSFYLLTFKDSLLPKAARVLHSGGSREDIILRELKVNKNSFSDSIFKLDYPKNADVIDKREE